MLFLEPEFKHRDARRTLSQLVTDNIRQVNIYEAKRGAILGNHFHKETIEYFYILKGTIVYNGEQVASKGSFFKVIPEEMHTIECLTDVDLMTFLTKPFEKENPDLWKK